MHKIKKMILIIGIFATLLFASQPAYAATYKYDKLGRLIETTYDSGKTVASTYDSIGNMTTVISSSVEATLTGIEFGSVPETMKIGEILNLTIKANYSDGTSKVLDNGVMFGSSNELIAKVDSTGNVTAIAAGNVTITAAFGGFNTTVNLTIIPALVVNAPVITTASGALNSGTVGKQYYAVIKADNEPTSFKIASGNLPDGLILGDNGVISGIPLTVGINNFSVTATNAIGTSSPVSFSIEIYDIQIVPSIPIFTDGNGKMVDQLSSDTLKVSMPIENKSETSVTLTMYVAVYSPEGKLQHIGMHTHEVEPAEKESFNVSLYMPQNADGQYAKNGYYANVFLWDNGTFVPVTNKYDF